jgi:hypothetical protein
MTGSLSINVSVGFAAAVSSNLTGYCSSLPTTKHVTKTRVAVHHKT